MTAKEPVRALLDRLCGDLDKWTGKPTADQMSRLAHYRGVVEKLEAVK